MLWCQGCDGVRIFCVCLCAVAQLEVEGMKALRKTGPADNKNLAAFEDPSASAMDRFASAARVSLKLQRLQETLDSVRV